MHNNILRIGCAAGFSGDHTDAAGPVVDALLAAGGPAFLIFETLAERTLALAQLARRANPDAGYEPLLDDMLRPVLARCLAGLEVAESGLSGVEAVWVVRRLAELLGWPWAPAEVGAGASAPG